MIIFWHVWDPDLAAAMTGKKLKKFANKYFQADKMLVLHSKARQDLERWGYCGRTAIATTCFEKCFDNLAYDKKFALPGKVLFMARLEKSKGIMTALAIAETVAQKSRDPIEFIIAGDGSAMPEAQEYVRLHKLDNVKFTGFVQGSSKLDILQYSHLFLQCSSHEGMPCSLLEAMACSLPTVTSAVGGIPDFFENGKMGFMLETMEPTAYAEKIIELLDSPEKLQRMGNYNYNYAREHFTARQAALRQYAEISIV